MGIANDFNFNIYRSIEGNNLLYFLAPTIYEQLKPLEQFAKEYLKDTKFGTFFGRKLSFLFIYLAVYWDLYKDSEFLKRYNHLPNPYEPAIKVLYRGDSITKIDGHFAIGGAYETRQTESTLTFRLPSLNDDFLDFIDSTYPLVNTLNIPNQEKINQLWIEFNNVK